MKIENKISWIMTLLTVLAIMICVQVCQADNSSDITEFLKCNSIGEINETANHNTSNHNDA